MTIIYVIIGLSILMLIFSGKLRVLVKGFLGIFIEDLAKTPEGVAAIYSEAINEAQKNYNEASDTYRNIAGQLETAKNKRSLILKETCSLEEKCVALAKLGKFDEVELFALQRDELISELDIVDSAISKLEIAYSDAKELNSHFEKELTKLSLKKSKVVAELKLNNDMNKMYDKLDKLKKVSDIDKLMGVVETNLAESRSMAVGAKEIYNNKISTKLSRAEISAKNAMTNSYVESLKQEYSINCEGVKYTEEVK